MKTCCRSEVLAGYAFSQQFLFVLYFAVGLPRSSTVVVFLTAKKKERKSLVFHLGYIWCSYFLLSFQVHIKLLTIFHGLR